MKHLRLLLILFFLSLLSPLTEAVNSQEIASESLPGVGLPSEQTYSSIESSSGVSKPNLRYGPGEWGNANKESPLPLESTALSGLLLLSSILITYRYIHTRQAKRKDNLS